MSETALDLTALKVGSQRDLEHGRPGAFECIAQRRRHRIDAAALQPGAGHDAFAA